MKSHWLHMTDKKTTFYKCILVNVYGDLWLHLLSAAEILPPSNSFICFFFVQIRGARIGLFWLNAGFYLCISLLYLCHAVFPLPFKTQPPCCTFDGWPTRLHAGPSSKNLGHRVATCWYVSVCPLNTSTSPTVTGGWVWMFQMCRSVWNQWETHREQKQGSKVRTP